MTFMMKCNLFLFSLTCISCAHKPVTDVVSPEDAARLDRKLVRNAVEYELGVDPESPVPDIAASRVRVRKVEAHLEGPKTYVGEHLVWTLEGDESFIDLPIKNDARKSR